MKPRLLEKAIQYAPGKCPVRATALQGQIDQYRIPVHCRPRRGYGAADRIDLVAWTDLRSNANRLPPVMAPKM